MGPGFGGTALLTHPSRAPSLAMAHVWRLLEKPGTLACIEPKTDVFRSAWIQLELAFSMQAYDVVVIGAGHNGLTCAAYLGMAGLKVKVLERRPTVGGAAVTEEFCPGFRNSVAAYTVSLLNPKIIADLRLFDHGLRIVERRAQNFRVRVCAGDDRRSGPGAPRGPRTDAWRTRGPPPGGDR